MSEIETKPKRARSKSKPKSVSIPVEDMIIPPPSDKRYKYTMPVLGIMVIAACLSLGYLIGAKHKPLVPQVKTVVKVDKAALEKAKAKGYNDGYRSGKKIGYSLRSKDSFKTKFLFTGKATWKNDRYCRKVKKVKDGLIVSCKAI